MRGRRSQGDSAEVVGGSRYTWSIVSHLKPFALYYLNDWCRYDSRFVDGLLPSRARGDRLRCLSNALNYYRVARTLPEIDEPLRLGTALAALDTMTGPITEDVVDSIVCNLASVFQSVHGRYAISAASKLLWIRFRSPVVIYDSQAVACLNKTAPTKLRGGRYKLYREEWLRQFAECEESIRAACAELCRVKDFSFARTMAKDELMELVSDRWFHERVFDKYLWSNGGNSAE